MSDPELLSAVGVVLSAVVALMALVLGPLMSIRMTGRQIRASARAQEMRERIGCLRADMAELVGIVMSVSTDPWLPQQDLALWKRQIDKVSMLKARISLQLRPDLPSHGQLNNTLTSLLNELIASLKPEAAEGPNRRLLELINTIPHDFIKVVDDEWRRLRT